MSGFTRKIRSLFQKNTRKNYKPIVNTFVKNEDRFKAAGSVFTDGKLILAGYQPRKRKPFISGIGGGRESGETYMQTAMRETLEELFEFEKIPDIVYKEFQTVLPKKILQNGNYIMVVYDFKDLEDVLKIVSKHNLKSVLYDKLPLTLNELLFNRKLTPTTNNVFYKPEISHLCLLPVVEHNKANPFVDAYFVEDMPLLMK